MDKISIEEMNRQFWDDIENYKKQTARELIEGKRANLDLELRKLQACILGCKLGIINYNQDDLRMHEAKSEVLIELLGLGTCKVQENKYSYPTELSSANLYNFKVTCPDIFEPSSVDINKFKEKIISTVKKGISLEEAQKGAKNPTLTHILIFITAQPQKAFFRKFLAETYAKENQCVLSEYVIMPLGNQTMIIGNPILSKDQEISIFKDLIADANNASPFDDMDPVGDIAAEILKQEQPNWPLGRK